MLVVVGGGDLPRMPLAEAGVPAVVHRTDAISLPS